jgi:hypothetical protein
MVTTMSEGTPVMLAQAMPMPIMGSSATYWLLMLASHTNETAAKPRQSACTRLAPIFWHQPTRNRATIIVTRL